MDNDKLVPLILVEYFCKMLGNIIDKLGPTVLSRFSAPALIFLDAPLPQAPI